MVSTVEGATYFWAVWNSVSRKSDTSRDTEYRTYVSTYAYIYRTGAVGEMRTQKTKGYVCPAVVMAGLAESGGASNNGGAQEV